MTRSSAAARFRQTDFQEKLARARRYQRKSPSEPSAGLGWRKIFAAIFFVALVYFFVISDFFLVDQAVVRGGSKADQVDEVLHELERRRYAYLIPKNNILFLNKRNLVTALQQYLPEVHSVKYFQRKLPNYLEVELEKRTALYIWRSESEHFLMDQDGVLFQEVPNYDPAVYTEFLITDRTGGQVKIGEELIIDRTLGFVVALRETWAREVSDLEPVSASLPGVKSGDILFTTSRGFEVYFDTQRDAGVQLKNLRLLLSRQIKPETISGLAYIDLRLPKVAYYCYKDAPCAQNSPQSATSTTPTN